MRRRRASRRVKRRNPRHRQSAKAPRRRRNPEGWRAAALRFADYLEAHQMPEDAEDLRTDVGNPRTSAKRVLRWIDDLAEATDERETYYPEFSTSLRAVERQAVRAAMEINAALTPGVMEMYNTHRRRNPGVYSAKQIASQLLARLKSEGLDPGQYGEDLRWAAGKGNAELYVHLVNMDTDMRGILSELRRERGYSGDSKAATRAYSTALKHVRAAIHQIDRALRRKNPADVYARRVYQYPRGHKYAWAAWERGAAWRDVLAWGKTEKAAIAAGKRALAKRRR